tara:strand:+ start:1161 stop:2195 length:1035 start_codon:yes stop_codon:yes gene_type:complete
MKLSFTTYRIECTHPFGISRSTHSYYDIVYIYLEHEGLIGRGEAAPSGRYNEFTKDILKILNKGLDLPEKFEDPKEFIKLITPLCLGIKALEVAFSMAILDWWCQKKNISLCEYFEADPNKTPKTSFTISIGDMAIIPEKIKESEPYHILKVKLGMSIDEDKAIINAIREQTDKVIRVDANEGWSLASGIDMTLWLATQNVEFIEQPFKSSNLEDTARLREESPLPIIADENSLNSSDIPKIHGVFDGINIKLMKCGNLFEAVKMIKMARERNMKIMLGCMIESSVGITAAAHLSPLVDYADLDGNLLIKNDPYSGVSIDNGKLILPNKNGLGISLSLKHKSLI